MSLLFFPTFFDTVIFLVLYVLIYNFALFLIFWTISQFNKLNVKTTYNLINLRSCPIAVATLTLLFFSIAGVPPFLGFFTKLLILISLLHTAFFFFYFAFIILLLFSLYFYMQNMRFLHTNTSSTNDYLVLTHSRTIISYIYITFMLSIIFSIGFLYLDDLYLFSTWLCL